MNNRIVILGALMLTCALSITGIALAQNPTVSLDPAEVATPAAGETLELTINISDAEDVFGWQIDVAYDSAALEFVSFTEGGYLKQGGNPTFAVPTNDGDLADDPDGLDRAATIGATSIGQAVSGDGDLGVVAFNVVSQQASLVKLINPQFLDSNVAAIAVSTSNATLTAAGDENEPPVAVAGADLTVGVGATIAVDGSGSTDDVGIASYSWDFGDGATAEGETATHIYSEAGNFVVTLTVADDEGETATDTLNVTVEAAREAIREQADQMIAFEAALPTADAAAQAHIKVWEGEVAIEAGMFLEYQIRMSSGNPTFQGGVDVTAEDGTALRDTAAVDDNNLAASPATDLEDFARDEWYHRQIPLDDLAGLTVTEISVGIDSSTHLGGLYRAYFDNIQITDGEFIVEAAYINENELSLATPVGTSTEAGSGGVSGATGASAQAGATNVAVDARGKLPTMWGSLKQR